MRRFLFWKPASPYVAAFLTAFLLYVSLVGVRVVLFSGPIFQVMDIGYLAFFLIVSLVVERGLAKRKGAA